VSWDVLLNQTADTLSTREELLRSCRELLAVVKTMPHHTKTQLARDMIISRAQQNIAKAAKETGLELDFGHLVERCNS